MTPININLYTHLPNDPSIPIVSKRDGKKYHVWMRPPPYNDYKTVIENLIECRSYEKYEGAGKNKRKWFGIEPGEHWIDMGGHIGTFAIRVITLGANVISFEPTPTNLDIYRKNCPLTEVHNLLVRHSWDVDIFQLPWTEEETDTSGHSTHKNKENKIGVMTITFKNAVQHCVEKFYSESSEYYNGKFSPLCLKLDIEGDEREILEKEDFRRFNKIAAEWHFQKGFKQTNRFLTVVDRLRREFGFNVRTDPKNIKPDIEYKGYRSGDFVQLYAWR